MKSRASVILLRSVETKLLSFPTRFPSLLSLGSPAGSGAFAAVLPSLFFPFLSPALEKRERSLDLMLPTRVFAPTLSLELGVGDPSSLGAIRVLAAETSRSSCPGSVHSCAGRVDVDAAGVEEPELFVDESTEASLTDPSELLEFVSAFTLIRNACSKSSCVSIASTRTRLRVYDPRVRAAPPYKMK